jgi:vancomycin resistance protein YoaR
MKTTERSQSGSGAQPKQPAPQKRPTAQQIAARKRAVQKQRVAVVTACALVVLALIGLIIYMIANPQRSAKDDGKILPNVYAGGINLGGMTEAEAANALKLGLERNIAAQSMVIRLPDRSLTLRPADTKISLDVNAVAAAAYRHGRGGSSKDYAHAKEVAYLTTHTVALLPYMELDLAYIRNAIDNFCASYGSLLTQPSATLSDTARPTYDPNYPSRPVTHQVLTVTMGVPGYGLDSKSLYSDVLDAYSLGELLLEYEAPQITQPRKLSAQDLFNQYCTQPSDAYMTSKPFSIVPETYGYGFDVARVQQLIDTSGEGQILEIRLGFLMPKTTQEELNRQLFINQLSEFTTRSPFSSSNRNANLQLSCKKLNNYVISDGETFSFNELMGAITAENGFKKSTEIINGKETEMLGGGISQTASTLYYCALAADLEIMERRSTSYAVDYTTLGLDAWVDGLSSDLKFRNNTGYPIRIVAICQGSSVSIQLVGTNTRDYWVDVQTRVLSQTQPQTVIKVVDRDNVKGYYEGQILQSGIVGSTVQTSVYKYRLTDNQLIATILIDRSEYNSRDEVIIAIEYIPSDPLIPPVTEPSEPAVPSDPTLPDIPTVPEIPQVSIP